MLKRPFNGSPTVDGYYTTFDSSEVHRIESTDEGGGGGGSSDFSTAEVVVTIGSNIDASMEGICILNDGDVDYLGTSYPISTDDTSVINAVLYKNEGSVTIQTTGTVTVTGNIRQMSPTDYLITGDCTITILQAALG